MSNSLQTKRLMLYMEGRNRDSSVGITTRTRAARPRIRNLIPGRDKKFFSSPQPPDQLQGPPSFQWVPQAVFPRVKRLGREADNSPPSSAKVKPRDNFWSRGRAVGIATDYGLHDRGVGVRVPVGARILFSPCRPDQFWWCPPSLLSNPYRGLIPLG
jgi:hypothetical protein